MQIINADIIFQGKLEAASDGDSHLLYEIPPGVVLYCTSIKAVNLDSASHTFNIYIVQAGLSPEIPYSDKDTALSAGKSVQVLDDPQECRIGPGCQIWGDCDEDDMVGVTIMGVRLAG